MCEGKGHIKRTINKSVKVPKGSNTGTVIKIPKMGGFNGNLLVKLEVETHPYFKREGLDIHTNQLITISQAVLGGTIEVPTIHGMQTIKLKPGTEDGSISIIQNYGVSKMKPNRDSKGNHCVHLKIKIPNSLNAKQKETMEAYSSVETRNNKTNLNE